MDYSREKDTDAIGDLILEFNVRDLSSMLIFFDSDSYFGFGDLSQAITPILANSTLVMTWLDFPPQVREKGKLIRIYAKRQLAGTLKTYINFMESK